MNKSKDFLLFFFKNMIFYGKIYNMKQYDIINNFTKTLIERKYINLAFLSGSYARKREDEYSNIDFYFVLNDKYEEDFYNDYYKLLSSFGTIIFNKNIDNKDIILVLKTIDLDININIHITDLNDLDLKNDILPLYDPYHLFERIDANISYGPAEIGQFIDKLALYGLDFERMYKRNDILIMYSIVSDALDNYVKIYRYYKNQESSKLNKKEFLSVLDKNERIYFINILKHIKIDSLKFAMILILDGIFQILMKLDLNVASEFDYDFYNYVLNKFKNLR